ncbi:12001_t:CDS:2, partial [Racocetra persica]
TLEITIDPKCFPTRYSTNISPKPDICDYCYQNLGASEEYYKCRIYTNVKSFVKRLEKGPNSLTTKEVEEIDASETIAEKNDTAEEIELDKIQNLHMTFLNKINRVSTW